MLAQQTTPEVVSFADLRSLAEAQRPCITVSIAIPDPLQLRTRMKDATREVERHFKAAGIEGATATVLLEPINSLAGSLDRAREWSIGLALFRSPDVFRYFLLPEPSWEFVTVSERFQIRPLLPLLSREQRFYILALSQKHIRLFYCTYKGEREVQLGRLAPQSLQDWMNARIPDHVLDNRAVGGPSAPALEHGGSHTVVLVVYLEDVLLLEVFVYPADQGVEEPGKQVLEHLGEA